MHSARRSNLKLPRATTLRFCFASSQYMINAACYLLETVPLHHLAHSAVVCHDTCVNAGSIVSASHIAHESLYSALCQPLLFTATPTGTECLDVLPVRCEDVFG
jgi:hypothetical protein